MPESESETNSSHHHARWRVGVIGLAICIGLFAVTDIKDLTGFAVGDDGVGCGGPTPVEPENIRTATAKLLRCGSRQEEGQISCSLAVPQIEARAFKAEITLPKNATLQSLSCPDAEGNNPCASPGSKLPSGHPLIHYVRGETLYLHSFTQQSDIALPPNFVLELEFATQTSTEESQQNVILADLDLLDGRANSIYRLGKNNVLSENDAGTMIIKGYRIENAEKDFCFATSDPLDFDDLSFIGKAISNNNIGNCTLAGKDEPIEKSSETVMDGGSDRCSDGSCDDDYQQDDCTGRDNWDRDLCGELSDCSDGSCDDEDEDEEEEEQDDCTGPDNWDRDLCGELPGCSDGSCDGDDDDGDDDDDDDADKICCICPYYINGVCEDYNKISRHGLFNKRARKCKKNTDCRWFRDRCIGRHQLDCENWKRSNATSTCDEKKIIERKNNDIEHIESIFNANRLNWRVECGEFQYVYEGHGRTLPVLEEVVTLCIKNMPNCRKFYFEDTGCKVVQDREEARRRMLEIAKNVKEGVEVHISANQGDSSNDNQTRIDYHLTRNCIVAEGPTSNCGQGICTKTQNDDELLCREDGVTKTQKCCLVQKLWGHSTTYKWKIFARDEKIICPWKHY